MPWRLRCRVFSTFHIAIISDYAGEQCSPLHFRRRCRLYRRGDHWSPACDGIIGRIVTEQPRVPYPESFKTNCPYGNGFVGSLVTVLPQNMYRYNLKVHCLYGSSELPSWHRFPRQLRNRATASHSPWRAERLGLRRWITLPCHGDGLPTKTALR